VIDHTGGIEGFSAYLAYYPEEKLVMAVLANLGSAGIYRQLNKVIRGDIIVLPSERKEVFAAPAAITKEYAGIYSTASNSNVRYSVLSDSGGLAIVLPNKTKLRLYAESEDRLFLKHRDMVFEFKRTTGKVTGLLVRSGGTEVLCTRE
jgi:hypothetical protein